jgi:hypothetical protein
VELHSGAVADDSGVDARRFLYDIGVNLLANLLAGGIGALVLAAVGVIHLQPLDALIIAYLVVLIATTILLLTGLFRTRRHRDYLPGRADKALTVAVPLTVTLFFALFVWIVVGR